MKILKVLTFKQEYYDASTAKTLKANLIALTQLSQHNSLISIKSSPDKNKNTPYENIRGEDKLHGTTHFRSKQAHLQDAKTSLPNNAGLRRSLLKIIFCLASLC